TPTAFYGVR
uniref:Tachykinin-related peptide TPTAFYGVR-amide n=1 Tax=Delia radicum TaxID=30064 RepID=TRP1_DELRA|nr:RecName: Full=Tachykinin-related peptide TPTAFYGVR-amide [Delia radicum]